MTPKDKKEAPLPPMLILQRTPVGLMEFKVKSNVTRTTIKIKVKNNSPACHLYWIKKCKEGVRLH